MERSLTPRQMAKGLLNGIVPARPLFLPIVFSLGAKVENVPLGVFLWNPTKISSALRQLRTHLRADGVACYCDPYLEVEALGATLQSKADDQAPTIHWPHPVRIGELPEGLRSPEEAAISGRVPVAVEVIRRVKALANRDFLLMASKFLEAGADLIIIQEKIVPALSAESCDAWANLLGPTINVVRFYEALPLLLFPCGPFPQEHWNMILRQNWNGVKCAPADVITSRRRKGLPEDEGTAFGIALQLDAVGLDGGYDKSSVQDIQAWISELRPSIVTTAGDVPAKTDMKHLVKVFEGVPRAV